MCCFRAWWNVSWYLPNSYHTTQKLTKVAMKCFCDGNYKVYPAAWTCRQIRLHMYVLIILLALTKGWPNKRRYCRPCHVDQVSIFHPILLLYDLTLCSPSSIEADVVVLASCIPTLQPLLEILLGKRAMGSYSQGKSDQLKTSSNFPSSFHRSKQSKPHDDLCFTNIDDQESQESILHNDDHGKNSLPLGRIHRKDDVVVEYESSPPKQGQGSAYSHWWSAWATPFLKRQPPWPIE